MKGLKIARGRIVLGDKLSGDELSGDELSCTLQTDVQASPLHTDLHPELFLHNLGTHFYQNLGTFRTKNRPFFALVLH